MMPESIRAAAPRSLGPLLLVVLVVLLGCSSVDEARPSPATRPAHKSTCAEAKLESGLPSKDRLLVPYGPTLLGVETTWGGEGQEVTIISGGYLDDVFEAYDDLEQIGTMKLRGTEATLFSSSLLEEPIRAAVWREDLEPPCDAHAIIAIGLNDQEFAEQLAGLR